MSGKGPSPDLPGLFRDLALILGLPMLLVLGGLAWWQPWAITYEAPEGTDVFALAQGTWDWAGAEEMCRKTSHTISFSPDRSVMLIAHAPPTGDAAGVDEEVTEYEILGHSASHIRGAIRGETRLTDSGVPVVWDLVLTSPHTYRWHRIDWAYGAYTDEVGRCSPGESRNATAPPREKK